MTTRKIVILTVAFCGLLLTAACTNDKEQFRETLTTTVVQNQGTEAGSELESKPESEAVEKVEDSEEASKETVAKAPSDQPASIGEALDYHGMIVTVHSVRESNGDDYLKPQEGNVLKVLDISVENTGDEELVVSSALSFSLSDDSGEMYMPVVTSDIKQSLDGKLAPGDKLQGEIPYEVSKEVKGLKLTYMIPLKDGEAVWTIE
ncbi:DUF4352 domain-containing protein [Paenibacillus sp. N3/727]|uniref:DUF4352 domain-containing protein n=1 Tax=Paenibacillus sp. N3/727 TaxID=2925845 RepID=UPI001F537C21|nr:DUF4352 domain-containing protein [Paenibacillus sp. N3/727]UNK18163.1 DUF4352 domain-containing protein [Paenibacillus sp. N3/727]